MNFCLRSSAMLVLTLVLLGCAGTEAVSEHVTPAVENGEASTVAAEDLYDAYPPGAPERCVNVRQVRRIEPIGNHTLLFHTTGGDVWRNRLPRSCPGLRRNSRFLYETRGGRLCALDVVYLVMDGPLGRIERGTPCPLGEFDFLTEDQAAALRDLR